jgi:hypothetical protein
LATAAAFSTLILSNIGNLSPRAAVTSGVATSTGALLADQNAFVPTSADVANAIADNNADVASALKDPNNLTTNLTNALLDSASTANASGMVQNADGNIAFQQPAVGSVSASFSKSQAVKKYQLPNWDAEVAAQKLNIAAVADPQKYSDTLNGIIVKNIIQTGASGMVGQDVDASGMAAIASPIQNAASEIANTPTPKQLVAFQKSLVAAMIYEKNMVALATLAGTDPVKASLIEQAESARYDQVMADFGAESEKASVKGLFSFNNDTPQKQENGTLAILRRFFGIQTANAQWPVFNPVELASWIKDEIKSILLQILKNTLTAFLQQRVLTMIQGSGAPKFVQQWGSTLATAYTQKAIASMSQVLANSCPNIGTLLRPIQANLQASANINIGGGTILSCPIPRASQGQLANFYADFNAPGVQALSGGGWGMYAQVLNPDGGNYFGTLLGASDYVNSQGSQAQIAAQDEAAANQGYTGQKQCDDKSDPNGTHTVCLDNKDNAYHTNPDGSCDAGYFPALEPNGGLCADGKSPHITTPGQTTLQAQQEALGGSLKLVTSANDIIGILETVGMSFLNTVAQAGINKATALGTQAATGGLLSITAGQPGTGGAVAVSSAGDQPINSTDKNLPTYPPTQCSPHNPTCSSGPGGQCSGGYLGDEMTFAATGGDGFTYTWKVPTLPRGISINVSSYSGPMFSPYFSLTNQTDPATNQPVIVSFPVTIPITVTGSDNATDTCLAVIAQ